MIRISQKSEPMIVKLQPRQQDLRSLPRPEWAAKKPYKSLYPWQTRLLRLEPGTFQDFLRCKLLTAGIAAFEGSLWWAIRTKPPTAQNPIFGTFKCEEGTLGNLYTSITT